MERDFWNDRRFSMIRTRKRAWLICIAMSLIALLGFSGCDNLLSGSNTTSTTVASGPVTQVRYYEFTDYEYAADGKEGGVLGAGVTHSKYSLTKKGDTKVNKLYLIDVDPSRNSNMTLRVGRPNGYVNGLATVKQMANTIDTTTNLTVLGGINADFFDIVEATGGVGGYTMSEGRWLTTGEFTAEATYTVTSSWSGTKTYTKHKGWAFGIKADGSPVISQPTVTMAFDSFTGDTQDHDDTVISILNQPRADIPAANTNPANLKRERLDNTIVLYTPDYAASTKTVADGIDVTFSTTDTVRSNGTINGTITDISTTGDVPLAAGTMVLSGSNGAGVTALSDLAVGDTIRISVTVDSQWADVVESVGGGRPDGSPLLVHGGSLAKADGTAVSALVNTDYSAYEEYSTGAGNWYGDNPRTAIGYRADGSYFFMVVDGRQTGVSAGATIPELAQFALDLGAVEAINMDGGRSSTMVLGTGVDGTYTVYNTPSATFSGTTTYGLERSDGDGIFVVTR
jgi:hypothetical protein